MLDEATTNSKIAKLCLALSVVILAMGCAYYIFQIWKMVIVVNDAGLFAELTRVLVAPDLTIYVDLWDNKPPGLFLFLAPFLMIFGNDTAAMQWGAGIEALLFAVSTGLLAWGLWQQRFISAYATLLAFFFGTLIMATRGVETTLLMSALGNISLYLIIRQSTHPYQLILSGFLFAWAVFSKQTIATQFLAMVITCLIVYARRQWLRGLGWIVLGGAIGIGSFLLWGWWMSDLPALWQYLVVGSLAYSPVSSLAGIETLFLYRESLPIMIPMTLFAGLALIKLYQEGNRQHSIILGTALACGLASALLTGRSFKITYFIQMMPFALVAIAYIIQDLYRSGKRWQSALMLMIVGVSVLSVQGYYQGFVPFMLKAQQSPSPTVAMSDYIADHSEHDDCLIMWGYAHNLHYYSGRQSCTSVPYEAMVMIDSVFDIERYRLDYMHDLFNSQPAFLYDGRSWSFFPGLQAYADRYVQAPVNDEFPQLYSVDMRAFQPMQVNFKEYFTLIGVDVLREALVCPGATVAYAPTWNVFAPPPTQYQLYIHIRRERDDLLITQYDGYAAADYPTQAWTTIGEVILSPTIELSLPDDIAPGSYKAVLGWYDLDNFEALPIVGQAGQESGQHEVTLDQFDITACP